jgi:hypothetical protein
MMLCDTVPPRVNRMHVLIFMYTVYNVHVSVRDWNRSVIPT